MMMRRYQEAIRAFALTLNNVPRAKTQLLQLRPDVAEYVGKQADQMSALLGICLTLSPTPLDQAIDQILKDKFAETLAKLQRMDLDEFVSSFELGCPKFISPETPSYVPSSGITSDAQHPLSLEPHRQQVELFKAEIAQQLNMPRLRSYLKLYTTLPTAKLSSFLDIVRLHTPINNLCCFCLLLYLHLSLGSL
ncbi:unnamed protein product [Protopolystoma xenopodis]|uniref:Uncharacterized protein n=1 Tax=Protopolystoma xenopodis TaxID=117903 RepID=A0A448XAT2_9PLAT|nr:unnamed protein product [Protopolystoma xenopodis]